MHPSEYRADEGGAHTLRTDRSSSGPPQTLLRSSKDTPETLLRSPLGPPQVFLRSSSDPPKTP